MSRIGKLPINIPEGVTVEIGEKNVKITGPNGTLTKSVPKGILIKIDGNNLLVLIKNENDDKFGALHGTTRAILANMVNGVKEGWSKKLELVGTGYRAEVSGNKLSIAIGFSHPVAFEAPEGINFKVEKTIITVSGSDKEIVGQIAAKIRDVRPPEPYKGKGIKYKDEIIRRKAGKAAKTAGAA